MKSFGSASFNTSYSFDGDKTAPLFVFIAADKEFKKPVLPGAHCHAKVLEGKMYRKVGYSKVLSLTEALSDDGGWQGKFHPSPSLHMLYKKHPFFDDRYIGVKQFHEVILAEKTREFCDIMRDLGAKTINWLDESPWVRNYEIPASSTPFLEEDKYVFLKHSEKWQAIVSERTSSWPDNVQVNFSYDDDYSLNDEIVHVLLKKLSVPASVYFGGDGDSKHRDLSAGDDPHIFKPLEFPVQVIFFSRSDFERLNRIHIVQSWGPEHLECLLTLWDMKDLIPHVNHHNVSIATMLSCKRGKQLEDLLHTPSKRRKDLDELVRKLSLLGDADADHLIEKVEEDAETLKVSKQIIAERKMAASVTHNQPKERSSHDKRGSPAPTTVIDANALDPGEYSLVMVGCGGIGKTSLLRYMLKSSTSAPESTPAARSEFSESELPTVGPTMYRCELGDVRIECWDTPGQDTERRGVLLHTRRADIIFVVYDISSAASLQSLHDVVTHMNKNGLLPWAAVCLIGNKADLDETSREVTTLTGINFARKYKFSNFFETSAKLGTNVNVAFSNALLKCEQERRFADRQSSFSDTIKIGSPTAVTRMTSSSSRASSVNGEREHSVSSSSSSKCAC